MMRLDLLNPFKVGLGSHSVHAFNPIHDGKRNNV